MPVCKYCHKEMMEVDDCQYVRENTEINNFADGVIRQAVPWGGYYPWPKPDSEKSTLEALNDQMNPEQSHCCTGHGFKCNVAPGNYHHPGCDLEVCPNCGGQLISCPCLREEENEDAT